MGRLAQGFLQLDCVGTAVRNPEPFIKLQSNSATVPRCNRPRLVNVRRQRWQEESPLFDSEPNCLLAPSGRLPSRSADHSDHEVIFPFQRGAAWRVCARSRESCQPHVTPLPHGEPFIDTPTPLLPADPVSHSPRLLVHTFYILRPTLRVG